MSLLSRNEKELVFDYCLGLADAEQVVFVRKLLAHNEQAADLRARLQAVLGPLRSVHPKRCPAELVGRTIRLLGAVAGVARTAARTKTTDSYLRT
jgi:anti-sigma-K factor RskA